MSRAPLKLLESRVEESFLDYNGHMNDAVYARLFSNAVDAFSDATGLGEAGRAQWRRTIYTLAALIHYLSETRLGEPLVVFGQVAHQRRLDVGDTGRVRRNPVVRHAGLHVGAERRRKIIDNAAAVAEPCHAELFR